MLYTRVPYLRSAILFLLIVAVPEFCLGLKDVFVTVPTAVKRGDSALLVCNYDIENDTLYSVKWYKGRREFYRYTPKENPAMKVFVAQGINVERTQSNQSHVLLTSVPLTISGKFSCEVSADAPTFHTIIVSGEMDVVEIPEQRPIITGIHSRYRLGDIINGNCSSDFSKPAANLTWSINDIPVMDLNVRKFDIQKHLDVNLESASVQINFVVTHRHFIRGRLKLKCTARIHQIYEQEQEKIIEEDRPRILASGRSPDMNMFPFDQQTDGEFTDLNELYVNKFKDSPSSANSLNSIEMIKFKQHQSTYHIKSALLPLIIVFFYSIFYRKIVISALPTNNVSKRSAKVFNQFNFENNSINNNNNSHNDNNNDIKKNIVNARQVTGLQKQNQKSSKIITQPNMMIIRDDIKDMYLFSFFDFVFFKTGAGNR